MWTQEQMRDFVRIVRDMRHYQREFFRTHDKAALQASKRLERAVDRLVESFGRGEKELFPCNTQDTL